MPDFHLKCTKFNFGWRDRAGSLQHSRDPLAGGFGERGMERRKGGRGERQGREEVEGKGWKGEGKGGRGKG